MDAPGPHSRLDAAPSKAALRLRCFPHPETKHHGPPVRPVFLPFAGCPHRCVFCGQDKQTGQASQSLEKLWNKLRQELASRLPFSPPCELAFFGGTFTALPAPWPERFLELAAPYKRDGRVVAIRCSTRPDQTDPDRLRRLRDLGLDLVELGIQSFDPAALRASERGYTPAQALEGCANVRDAGLKLGLQFMPGMPGSTGQTLEQDMALTAGLRPEGVRLYPCVVIAGTPLATRWHRREFRPWSLERTRQELALALGTLYRARIPIWRVGLHPEPDLLHHLLAGPWHPALGQMVRSLALFDHVRTKSLALGTGPKVLYYPRRWSGEIMGHGAELRPRWERADIRLHAHGGSGFILRQRTAR